MTRETIYDSYLIFLRDGKILLSRHVNKRYEDENYSM